MTKVWFGFVALLVACGSSEDAAPEHASAGAGSSAGSSGNGGSAGKGGNKGGATSAGASGADDGGSPASGAGQGGGLATAADCEPLEQLPADAIIVDPGQADDLPGIVQGAAEGATIALSAGTYTMTGADEASRRIQITKPGITLRSVSGNADEVVIDAQYATNEIVTVNASDVTVAGLTLLHAVDHAVHVTGGAGQNTENTRLHGLVIRDCGEQFVKVNTSGLDPNTYADAGILECSLLEMTSEGRPNVEPNPGGCYTGGIDGHQAQGWTVRLNTFRGIYCENGSLAEHAVHFWTASRDTLVERNTIIDCARGIGFGLGDGGGAEPDRLYADDPAPGIGYVGHYDGIIRNNVISISEALMFFDTGIELEQAHGARVLHNTILHPVSAFASVAPRFANSLVTLENNILVSLRERDGALTMAMNNLTDATSDLFVDAAGHDLHLLAGAGAAIDQAAPLDDAGLDIDGEAHDQGAPDLGADEHQ